MLLMTIFRNIVNRFGILTALILLVVFVFLGSCSMKKAVRSFIGSSPASTEQASLAEDTRPFLVGDQCSHLDAAVVEAKVVQQASLNVSPEVLIAILQTIRFHEEGWKPDLFRLQNIATSVPVYLRNMVFIV